MLTYAFLLLNRVLRESSETLALFALVIVPRAASPLTVPVATLGRNRLMMTPVFTPAAAGPWMWEAMTPVMLVSVIVHSIEVPRSTKVVTPVPGVVLTGTSFAGDRLAT